MKSIKFSFCLICALAMMLAATGCKKKPTPLTNLPDGTTGVPIDLPPTRPINVDDRPIGDDRNVPFRDERGHVGWPKNREAFAQYVVHFAFDSSVVNPSEQSKIAAVADYLKSNPSNAVEIEGHCDERGTEEYNRSLGERRALALREELVRMGIDPTRVDTISYGEDRPVAQGSDESAYAQNRRGEFILLTPP